MERERIAKEQQAAARRKAEQDAERERVAKEQRAAEAETQRRRAIQEEKTKVLTLARTEPTVQAIVSGELKFYIESLPNYAASGAYGAVNEIASAFTAMPLYGATIKQVHDERSADLVISWVRDYGSHTIGQSIFKSHIKVGLGSTNCLGDWRAFTSNTLKKIIWHELGHSMGYGHSVDPDNVMYSTTDTRYEVYHVISDVVVAGGWWKGITLCDSREYGYRVESADEYTGFTIRVLPPDSDPNLVAFGGAPVYTNCGAAGMVRFSNSCTVSSGSMLYIQNDQLNQAIRLSGEIVDLTSLAWPDMAWDPKVYRYNSSDLDYYWNLFN